MSYMCIVCIIGLLYFLKVVGCWGSHFNKVVFHWWLNVGDNFFIGGWMLCCEQLLYWWLDVMDNF